jgi:penicillin-binding protein 2
MLIFDQLRKNDPPLRALSLLVLAGMAVLLAGLWYVQVVSARRYQASLETQSFRTVRIPAIRGKIYDRNGIALADNKPNYAVNLYLEELRAEFQQRYRELKAGRPLKRPEVDELSRAARYDVVNDIVQGVGSALEKPLEVTPASFHRHYERQRSLPLTLADELTPRQIALYWERRAALPGLDLDVQPSRFYPFGTAAAHLLGYLQRADSSESDLQAAFHYRLPDVRGMVGIKGAFDEKLRGKAGVKSVLVNNLGYRQSETVWAPAEPGHNVHLTLDVGLQRVAERALQGVYPVTRGAVIVMDAQSGDLLVLASSPAFDPSHFPGISHEEYARLNDEKHLALFNRASQGYLQPGSIFKIVTALACLEAGTLDPEEVINNPGFFRIGHGAPIKDAAKPGDYDFKRAFVHSSNTYFIHQGLKAGPGRIVEMGQRFFLGEPTGIPTLQDQRGRFPELKDLNRGWFDGDTANLCIGQGAVVVSPLQMAVMTCAVVNGGKVFWPRIVDRIEPMDPASPGRVEQMPAAQIRGELKVNPRHLALIREAMVADVEETNGTGRRAAVPGLVIGGKTGTAENKRGRTLLHKTTWFTSFAATDHEAPARYVVLVMVESGASGGLTCAPVAGEIYREIQRREAAAGRAATVAQAN